MPFISSNYRPPLFFRQPDVATVFSSKFREVNGVIQTRERLELPDGDFLDVDWSFASQKSKSCVILLHGLEGSAKRPYILGSAKVFNANKYDVCAMNYRGCSGEQNRLFATYHSAKTDDLQRVVQYVLTKGYDEIIIKGFSMGGNISLFYAGTQPDIPKEVKAVIAVSTPCDLAGCSEQLLRNRNWPYAMNFLNSLKKKIEEKQQQFPEKITTKAIESIKTLKDFDNVYTAKANNFANADDYYEKCSSLPYLKNITLPTLILNAKNDTFLSDSCYPYVIAQKMTNLYLEIPKFGGHVAFYDKDNVYYNEKRALAFAQEFK